MERARVAACEETSSPSRTLEKGLQVLNLFDVAHPEWSLKGIRETAGLPKATGFRLVKTLEKLKYLAYDPRTRVYRLGSAMMKAAYLTQTNESLVALAEPHIRSLAEVTTETVDIAVPTDQGAMIVHTVYTARPFRPYTPPGMVLSGLGNVHSKIFAAYGPEAQWSKAIAGSLPQTPLTLVDPQRLVDEFAKVRHAGVAFGMEEHKPGMCAVGAPVFDSTGRVRAGLAVVVPVERFGETERRAYAEAVIDAAARLSRELGYAADHDKATQGDDRRAAGQQTACGTPPSTTRPRDTA